MALRINHKIIQVIQTKVCNTKVLQRCMDLITYYNEIEIDMLINIRSFLLQN